MFLKKEYRKFVSESSKYLTEDNEYLCPYCQRIFNSKSGFHIHLMKYFGYENKGHKNSEEVRKKISDSMKKAHREGRAYNIGNCKHKHEPSYPEKFFMKVIENEFVDKNYISEFPFDKYRLDFAWPHLKKYIEIDGEQHERKEHLERDIKKDELLSSNGWKVLRIKWKVLFNNSKEVIQISKKFIETNEVDYEELLKKYNYKLLVDNILKISEKESIKEFKKVKVKKNKYLKAKREVINLNLVKRRAKKIYLIRHIKNSDIDFTKKGWCRKVAENILHISFNGTGRWMKKNMPKFYRNCFKEIRCKNTLPTKDITKIEAIDIKTQNSMIFSSLSEACLFLSDIEMEKSRKMILKVIRNNKTSYKGYIWNSL